MSAFLHDAVLLYGLAYNTSLPSLNNSEATNISYEQFQDLETTFVGKSIKGGYRGADLGD